MLKTVYFDLGNVLIFFSLKKMIDQIGACTQIPLPKIQALFLQSTLREQYEKGLITTEQLYRHFLQEAPRPFSLAAFTQAFNDIFTPNRDLWPLIDTLKQKKIRLILLSNTSESHYNYIAAHYPILKLFDDQVLSYQIGSYKPEPEIFQKALGLSQCAPDECFYTDDIPEFIESAQKVGLPGAVFTTVPELKAALIRRGLRLQF